MMINFSLNYILIKKSLNFIEREKTFIIYTHTIKHCGMEQLVARRAHNPKVVSSSLAPATKGKVAEWSNATVLKTVDLQGSVGSNPTFSARKNKK